MRALGWVLTLVSAGIMAAFQLVIGPRLDAFAGGLPSFDARMLGYTVAEARAYLAALPPEGVAYYLGVFHPLDFIFPAALSLWLWLPLRGVKGAWRLLWLLPIGYAICDYAENLSVRTLLQTQVSDGFIARTALISQGKWALALLALAVASVAWLRRRKS